MSLKLWVVDPSRDETALCCGAESRFDRYCYALQTIKTKSPNLTHSPLSHEKTRLLRKRLNAAYAVLVPKLARLVGYRIVHHPVAPPFLTAFSISSSGDLLYRLESPIAGPFGYLEFDKSGATDAFATKMVGRFQSKSKRLFASCHHTRAVEQILLKEQEFFWDDLIVGFKYPKNSHYSLLETLWILRRALHFRYEGQLPRVGVLLTWNIGDFVSKSKMLSIPLIDTPGLDQLLFRSKAAHLLSDAEAAIYVVRGAKAQQLMYRSTLQSVIDHPGWEFVPGQYRWLGSAVQGRDMAIINSGVGEQIVITAKAVLKWVGGQWTRLSHSRIAALLPDTYSDQLKSLILDVVGNLSQHHTGALLILPEDVQGLLSNCGTGLSKTLSGSRFMSLTAANRTFFERLCGIDGGVIVSSDGYVIDAGVIVNIPEGGGSEGARSTAAAAASHFGVAIKVSHDGPITIFRQGIRVATVS